MTWTAAPTPFSTIGAASTWSLGEGVRQMDLEFDTLTSAHPTSINKQNTSVKQLSNNQESIAKSYSVPKSLTSIVNTTAPTRQTTVSHSNTDTITHIGRSAIMEMDKELEYSRTHQTSMPASNQRKNSLWLQDTEAHKIDRQLREILDSDSAIDEFYADVDAAAVRIG
jgi:hypothetical protein